MAFDSVEAGFDYLESFVNLERGGYSPRRWRLERMRALLEAFGDPHRAYDTIHVAGSKGKGSTAAYAAYILDAAGHRTGLYTSPHVESYRERIQILDGSLTDAMLIELFERIAAWVDGERERVAEAELPTTFELVTLLAFLAFERAGCDYAVIEVGMGGRLDATNLVRPRACIITPIELEHTDYLGPTLRSIAGEKGAIIKRGTPVFVSPQHPEALAVITRIAELRRAPITRLDETGEISGTLTAAGTDTSFALAGRPVRARLRLLGEAQARNAALAAYAVHSVLPGIPIDTIEAGLSATWLPGRAELLPGFPPLLLDGAHTPVSIALVCRVAETLCPDRSARTVVFGAVDGKSHAEMLRSIIESFSRTVICRPGTFKRSDPEALARMCIDLGGTCEIVEDGALALDAAARAVAPTGLIVGTGSFYLVGKLRTAHRSGRNDVA